MILLNLNDKVKGDSQIDGHAEWITIDSVNLGVSRPMSTSGTDRDTVNPIFSEVTLSKSTDKASCDLFWQACGGKQLGKATIEFVQVDGEKPQTFMKIELAKAIVTSYNASSAGDRPHESITLNFTEAKVSYTQYKDGESPEEATPRGWNIVTNTNKLADLA